MGFGMKQFIALLDSEMGLSITWDNLDISSHKKIKRVQY